MSGNMFTSYDDSGRIISVGRAMNYDEQVPETGGIFVGAIFDGDTFYFKDGKPEPRPEPSDIKFSADSVPADGESTIELLGVPAGAQVYFGGQVLVADGSPIELSTNMAGGNRVVVDAFPVKLWTGWFNGAAY